MQMGTPDSNSDRVDRPERLGDSAGELPGDGLEAVAYRVVEILERRRVAPGELIDAGELARRFGVSRAWVYSNAELLGAIRLGGGRRARLRFDPYAVARALAGDNVAAPRPVRAPARQRMHRRPDAVLLPIDTSRGPRGAMRRRGAPCLGS